MSDKADKPWYAKYEAAQTREMLSRSWARFKNALREVGPSDWTREAWGEINSFWKFWTLFVIGINAFNMLFSLADHEWDLAILYFVISAAFALLLWGDMIQAMQRKSIRNLLDIAAGQQQLLREYEFVVRSYEDTDPRKDQI